jgi:hypothetical protein
MFRKLELHVFVFNHFFLSFYIYEGVSKSSWTFVIFSTFYVAHYLKLYYNKERCLLYVTAKFRIDPKYDDATAVF